MRKSAARAGSGAARRAGRAIAVALVGVGTVAQAEVDQRDPTIANLPRPGYEPRTIHAGTAMITPVLEVDALYDDNILATRDNPRGDAIFSVRPTITADREGPTLDLHADAHADLIRYARTPREDVDTFGLSLDGTKRLGTRQTILVNLGFDRTFERRSDPEADIDAARSPALINFATADLTYRYQGPRIGAQVTAGISKIDYLSVEESEKDLLTYRAALRGSVKLNRRVAVFVEGFANRREMPNADWATGGVFGTTTTLGLLSGVSFDVGEKFQGEIGAGVFSANPDEPLIPTSTGPAVSGRLTWRPRVRTAIVFDIFRGDVATVRSGALGRIDTRASLVVDQEVRHNLLLHAAAGVRDIRYRGGIDNNQRYVTGEVEVRYLLNRYLTLVTTLDRTWRAADLPEERFTKWQALAGVKFTY